MTRDPSAPERIDDGPAPSFDDVYDRYFDFVWRAARRLGVAQSAVEDISQETFLVVHRRFGETRTSSLRSWIYGITLHTVRNHRRALRRKSPHAAGAVAIDPDDLADHASGPDENAERAEAARVLHAILGALDDEKREVFVLVELEQLPVTEVAVIVGEKLNTIYSRLRLARTEFETAVRRHHAAGQVRHAPSGGRP